MAAIQDTIARVAQDEGIDPAYALAVAERESRFDPNASGTGSIRGLYQMTGANRRKYGLADDASVEDQVRAFARFTKDLRADMAARLGREPTNAETYLGHYWGGGRAAGVVGGGHGELSPGDVFSARELEGNPNLRKYATVGGAAADISKDMERRFAKHGGESSVPPHGANDFAAYGEPVDGGQLNAPSDKKLLRDADSRQNPSNPDAAGDNARADYLAMQPPSANVEDRRSEAKPDLGAMDDQQLSATIGDAILSIGKAKLASEKRLQEPIEETPLGVQGGLNNIPPTPPPQPYDFGQHYAAVGIPPAGVAANGVPLPPLPSVAALPPTMPRGLGF